MKTYSFLTLVFVLAFFTWSCGGDASEEEKTDKITIEIDANTDDIEKGIEEGMRGMEEGLEEMTSGLSKMMESLSEDENGNPITTADFRDLKALLPDRLLRMERTEHSGERSGIAGLKVSTAEAKYEDEERYLEVTIVDGGGMGLAKIAHAGLNMAEVDKETRDGFERTTTIDGHKAYEKYNSRWEEGELVLLYENRFIITLKGKGLGEGDLRRALARLDLDELRDIN